MLDRLLLAHYVGRANPAPVDFQPIPLAALDFEPNAGGRNGTCQGLIVRLLAQQHAGLCSQHFLAAPLIFDLRRIGALRRIGLFGPCKP